MALQDLVRRAMAIVALKNARRLRHLIELRSWVETVEDADDSGDINARTPITEQELWADIMPMSFRDQERLVAGGSQIQQEATHKVVVRPIEGITTDKWFKFGTRRLEILSVADRRERGVLMEILCKEVVGQDG